MLAETENKCIQEGAIIMLTGAILDYGNDMVRIDKRLIQELLNAYRMICPEYIDPKLWNPFTGTLYFFFMLLSLDESILRREPVSDAHGGEAVSFYLPDIWRAFSLVLKDGTAIESPMTRYVQTRGNSIRWFLGKHLMEKIPIVLQREEKTGYVMSNISGQIHVWDSSSSQPPNTDGNLFGAYLDRIRIENFFTWKELLEIDKHVTNRTANEEEWEILRELYGSANKIAEMEKIVAESPGAYDFNVLQDGDHVIVKKKFFCDMIDRFAPNELQSQTDQKNRKENLPKLNEEFLEWQKENGIRILVHNDKGEEARHKLIDFDIRKKGTLRSSEIILLLYMMACGYDSYTFKAFPHPRSKSSAKTFREEFQYAGRYKYASKNMPRDSIRSLVQKHILEEDSQGRIRFASVKEDEEEAFADDIEIEIAVKESGIRIAEEKDAVQLAQKLCEQEDDPYLRVFRRIYEIIRGLVESDLMAQEEAAYSPQLAPVIASDELLRHPVKWNWVHQEFNWEHIVSIVKKG